MIISLEAGSLPLPQYQGVLGIGLPWVSFELVAVLPGSGVLSGGAPRAAAYVPRFGGEPWRDS